LKWPQKGAKGTKVKNPYPEGRALGKPLEGDGMKIVQQVPKVKSELK
jgi:hypothetical protein